MTAKAQACATDLLEIIRDVQTGGAVSLRDIAAALSARHIPMPRRRMVGRASQVHPGASRMIGTPPVNMG